MLGVQRGTVSLVPYSPEWERRFGEEEQLLLFRGYLRQHKDVAEDQVNTHKLLILILLAGLLLTACQPSHTPTPIPTTLPTTEVTPTMPPAPSPEDVITWSP